MKSLRPEGAPPLEISIEELETLVEQVRPALSADGYQKLLGAVHTLRYVTELLKKKEASLADLRELLCPATTEKTEKVLKQAGIDTGPEKPSTGPEAGAPKRKARGHELNDINAFDYLTELLRHPEELKQNPAEWMPWNYRDTLAQLATPVAA